MTMNTRRTVLALIVCMTASMAGALEDEGWPRVMEGKSFTVTMYQPQIDTWVDDLFEARAAVSVADGEGAPVFGAVWITGRFDVDLDTRMVDFDEITIPTVAFPDASEEDQDRLAEFLEAEIPKWDLEIELDRVIPLLENAEVATRDEVEIKNNPPKIIITYTPAVLVLIDGEPKLEKIEESKLERVVNTPFVIVKNKNTYYLASDTMWFDAPAVKGPWSRARSLPKKIQQIDDQLKKQRADEGAPEPEPSDEDRVPQIVVSTVPAELIFIDGKPEFTPLQTSEIMVVSNTDSDLVFVITGQSYYALLSGRWYRTKDLDNGPWTWVANDELPVRFAEIPADSDVGYLRTSVAGTEEAREALLEQAVPQTAEVKTTAGASFSVAYDGSPQFKPIEGTGMTYAVNTSASVIFSGGRYYCCDQGIWYESAAATGPWMVSKKVPDEIYTIPPSNPLYNVTYVKVYDSTPEVVYVGYTPGYTSSYVSHGCVVYGTGWYYPPYWGPGYYHPYHSTWGFHVRWNPWYGWSFGLSYSTGPFRFSFGYGGWGGSWGRGWWGPVPYRPYPRYGYGAGYRAGYRHGYANGRYAGNRPVHYGNTNININNNIYGRPSNADRVATTRDRGTRPQQQPAVARDRANNVYADKQGNVYRRNDNGNWDRREGGGWKPTDVQGTRTRPATGAKPSTRPSTGTAPSTRPSTGTLPSTRPSTGTAPSIRPSTGSRPSTMPSTGSRPSTRPSTGSLNRDYSARQRGNTRTQQYRGGGGGATRRPSGGGRRR
ncbi:MAG: carbohydrate-binding family V/XII [Acidobacteriota bacterium]|nr:carbohydrate-binding family V/XII [Acidobacteriota bacterium]